MKEQRDLQTLIDQLEQHIKAQAAEIERLQRDALRYRWLNKYTSQLFMVTEPTAVKQKNSKNIFLPSFG